MKRIINALLRYFIKGLLLILPMGAAILILFWAFTSLDSVLNFSDSFITNPNTGEPLYIPGLGILSVIVIILFFGIIATYLITEPIYNWFGRWLNRIPVFKFLYSSVKDITEAIVGDEKKLNEPVLVETSDGTKKIGFLTQKDLKILGLTDEVAVYFPWSYSFAGELVIVKADKIKPLPISSSQAMKFIVSGGVSSLHD
ncbi:hypothetical protein PBAC_21090 [Pedobacter glucosidilyticus]|nr:DUF502 domain-containing protein [Pedobacter glucosidilyticus]KHJ37645.1 hypothetical protein PBAC_21090 [Pedobacter glucosidilyticus]